MQNNDANLSVDSSDSSSEEDDLIENKIINSQARTAKSGSSTEESAEGGKIKGKTKVYHENQFTKLDTKINLHKISNEIENCEKKEFTK